MDEREVVEFVKSRLDPQFTIQRIILFGSRARGETHDQSDWDFLLIVDSDIPFAKRQADAMEALGKHPFPVDLLVYTASEAERAASILGSSVYWAQREGRIVA